MENKKRIAIIYQGAKFYGGIETYLEQLFLNIDKNQFELTLVSLGEWELTKKLRESDEKVITIPFHWYEFYQLYGLYTFFSKAKFDLIVSQGMVANFYARISAYFAKIPNLITIHSNYDFDFHGTKKALYFLTFKVFDFMTRKYIVVSKYLRGQVQKLGVSPSKIKVVYNGVQKLDLKQKKAGQELIVGTMGRLHFTKGYHNLIHAISLIKNEQFKVYIWGEGEERNQLDSLIKQHHLVDKVEFRGFEFNKEKVMEEIDAYIQPSLSEGFGITVVEAMYAEKPVIVTPAGSLPELITDGKTGLVTKGFSPEAIAATLDAVIDDPKLALALGKEARKDALSRFSVKRWIEETQKVFWEAME